MLKKIIPVAIVLVVAVAAVVYWERNTDNGVLATFLTEEEEEGEEDKEERAMYIRERALYEYNMLKDPATNRIPKDIYEKELNLALRVPLKMTDQGPFGMFTNNTYLPAGPDNQGGRTRAAAFDKRYNGTSNQVIIAGSVSGGIFRSTNGGSIWTRVTPENQIHNVTALAQDPRPGFQDTWYAAGGEPIGNSAAVAGAFYYSEGVLKSTDNGLTWTKLPLAYIDQNGNTVSNSGGNPFALEAFEHPFDIVHNIIVNPVNGDVYAAAHRRLMKSVDGGNSFRVVFIGAVASTADAGQMDITCSSTGRLFLAVNGGFPDLNLRGVFTSTTGNFNQWTRIAGGSTLNVDSLDGWRGNSYTLLQAPSSYESKRIILALAPSNNNILYVCYENGLSQEAASGAKPEVDMYRMDVSAIPGAAVNLSANMPDFPGQVNGIDPIAVQGGYDMLLAVKPDNPNVVFVGGTNLYRSTDGFTSTANTEWIGGYGKSETSVTFNLPTHPDMHLLVFDPSNPSRAMCGNDGGLQIVNNIMAALPIAWVHLDNYQTLQYYHVAIDPDAGFDFIGGAQDNGTHIRQGAAPSPNFQTRINSGDGGMAAIAVLSATPRVFTTSQLGSIVRQTDVASTNIKPTNSEMTANPSGGHGEFVTYFKMDFNNPEDIYYVNFNKIFRTTAASTVTGSGWTYMSGIASTVNPANPNGTNIGIRALELSSGPYFPSHSLFIGTTGGKLYRLDNPRNAIATATPVDITPTGSTGTISDISSNPNNDEELLVTFSNYGVVSVYWTNNAKAAVPTWRNAEGNLTIPSFRSCQIVVKKDGAGNPVQEYYVGTSVGLYSATNIGQTLAANQPVNWVREGGNVLNFAVIQSMDYRPSDNVMVIGTHGNGMFYASAGTPNYTPNQNTAVNDPVVNDKKFIRTAFPTITSGRLEYRVGEMFTVKKLVIRIHNAQGQLLLQKETGYQDGVLNVSAFARGAYVLTITSSDYKQQFVRQFVKD